MHICDSEFGKCVGKYSRVLYLCHRNADPDAIGSANALCRAFGGAVGAVDDISRTGAALMSVIGVDVVINPRAEDYDLVVVVDTSVRLQLGGIALSRYALVDHHQDDGLLPDAQFYIQRPTKSTAEIVWSILKENGKKPGREAALGLLVGMISDTGRFRRATPEAFHVAAELLEVGGFEYEEALSAISVPTDISRRIAILKAATRAKVIRVGNYLIATTDINSFEGSAAMALVDLGADVAFAAGKHGRICRVSARAGREAARAGLDLAEISGRIAKRFCGEGGGHKAAAAFEAGGETKPLLEECKNAAAECLQKMGN